MCFYSQCQVRLWRVLYSTAGNERCLLHCGSLVLYRQISLDHSTGYTDVTASFSSGPIALAISDHSAPGEWSIRARGDFTGSAGRANSNVRDPYSRRLAPLHIVFDHQTDSTYIRPHTSHGALVQSTIVFVTSCIRCELQEQFVVVVLNSVT